MSKTTTDTRPLLLPDNPCIWDFKSDHAPREDRNPTRIMPPELKILLPKDHPSVIDEMEDLEKRKRRGKLSKITSRVWEDWEWRERSIRRCGVLDFVATYLHNEIQDICGTDIYHHADGELDLTLGMHKVIVEHNGKRYDCAILVYLSPEGGGGRPQYRSLVVLEDRADDLWRFLDLRPRTFELQDGGSVDLLCRHRPRRLHI